MQEYIAIPSHGDSLLYTTRTEGLRLLYNARDRTSKEKKQRKSQSERMGL